MIKVRNWAVDMETANAESKKTAKKHNNDERNTSQLRIYKIQKHFGK